MNEVNINLNYHISKDENNVVDIEKVNSSLDELSVVYDGIIIVTLIKDLFTKIYKNIDDLDEDSIEFDKIMELGDKFQNSIIQATLNYCYNILADKTNNKNFLLEYSIAVYDSFIDKDKNVMSNILSYTTHSDNINMFEPIFGATAFFMDTIDCMYNNNIPKDEIQKIIKSLIYKHTKILLDYIDEIDIENEKDD